MTERRYSVVWTEIATLDIERIAGYLFDESPLRARDVVDRIIARADSQDRSPDRGRLLRELRFIGDRTWREIQETPWRIVYRVAGAKVENHGVLDGRRDLEDILLERLLQA